MSRKTKLGAMVVCLGVAATAMGQVVPGYGVELFATVEAPMVMDFDPAGNLYVGSGGTVGSHLPYKIGPGGSPIGQYGDTLLSNADAALWDADGTITGVPGSLLTGGWNTFPTTGGLYGILPDETVTTLYEDSPVGSNPYDMEFDGLGNVIMADDRGVSAGEIYRYDGTGSPQLLFTSSSGNASLTVDTDLGYIYTGPTDGTIQIHDLNGNPVDTSWITGLSTGISTPVELGPGSALFDGYMYAISRPTGELLEIATDGTYNVIGTGFGDSGSDRVGDLRFGTDGYLYVSFFNRDEIIRIVPEPASLLLIGLAAALLRRR